MIPTVEDEDESRHDEAKDRIRRDFERFQHRDEHGQFRRSLALVGSVGWPIVLLATGGAFLGRYLDRRFGSGVQVTLGLLTLATVLGTYVAYRTLREDGK